MSASPHPWLTTRAAPPGMLACGWRAPDGTFDCHSLEEMCPVEKLKKILTQFDAVRGALFSDQLAPRWSTWCFEHGQIRFVARADGWLLALVARPESDALAKLDPLSWEFLTLPTGG
jgi:hypothetical protein